MRFDFIGNDTGVFLGGELTFTDHTVFLEVSNRLFQATEKSIVIDLSKLEFIDSAGLGMLLITREEAQKANRNLVLRAPRGQVKRMFAVTKFESLFNIET